MEDRGIVRLLAGAREIFSSPWCPTRPPIQWVRGTVHCLGVKRPGRGTNCSPPSGTKINTGGGTPPVTHLLSCYGA
jgi:hypothetical protein